MPVQSDISIIMFACCICVCNTLSTPIWYCLQTTILNKHLQTLMEGLTAKVFRTYNASFTLQQQLDLLSEGWYCDFFYSLISCSYH